MELQSQPRICGPHGKSYWQIGLLKSSLLPVDTLRAWKRTQIRKGTAKQEMSVSRGAISRMIAEKIIAGGLMLEHSMAGNSLRMPAMTKNIPVSKRTEMIC